jgi:Carboxypeptidase regulatory-like domain
MHRYRIWALCLLALLFLAPLAFAQTTGSVSGVARDSSGAPLPGVLVSISGPQMPLGRTATTRSDGTFQFLNLTPGTYKLRAELQGLGAFQQEVIVAAIKDTEVRPVLHATATEEVTVTAATPLIDTKESGVTSVTKRAALEKLPLNRTFSGTFQLAPGVADSGVAITNTNVGVNAGGGRQDNTFFYDGVNVTNPFFGDAYQDFAELDIQEVSFTRGGVTPEYGRTGGFIVNGVTKSGTNNFHGEARIEYQPSTFEADSKDATNAEKSTRFRPGFGIGGPILQDHLFGYGSVNLLRQDIKDRTNQTGSLPNSNFDIDEYFVKLSATPVSNQLIDASFRYRGIDQDNTAIDVDSTPSTGSTQKEISRVGVFNWFWTATPQWNFDFKFNYFDNPGYSIPTVAIPFQPAFNAANPASVGYFCTGGVCDGVASLRNDIDNFKRLEYKFTTSYATNFLGANHLFKLGGYYSDNEEEKLTLANGWGSITINNDSDNCLGADSCYRARFNPNQPSQISRGHTIGIFLQDQATWNRLTLNIGFLVNQDTFIPNDNGEFTFVRGDYRVPNDQLLPCTDPSHDPAACTYTDQYVFPFNKQWQPRVGLAYEVDTRVHDKAFVNYARYDNMDNQSFARAAAPIRLYRTDAFFDLQTGAFLQEFTRSNNTGKIVLGNIDPTYTDEFVAGYSRPLPSGWSVELWGMFRQTKDIFEDFPSDKSNVDSDFRYGNIPAFRKYKAGTLEIRKAYADNWSLDVSYTYSRLTGNWDLDYATELFYTSSYIEDGPGLYVEDPNRTGLLIGNRTHVAKFFANYTMPWQTILGGYLRVQSGRPWEARLFDPSYGTDYEYAETAGKRLTPTWANLDLLVAQNFNLGPGVLRLEGRLMNVFNTQTVLTVNQDLFLSDDNTDPNPRFGQGTSFATPRRFILAGIFSF